MTIQVFVAETGVEIPVDFSTFPGGEEHVRVTGVASPGMSLIIEARITNSSWWMRLVMLDDALVSLGCIYTLKLPYMPYARQDRVCNTGEAAGASRFGKELKGLKYCRSITLVDVHSPAARLAAPAWSLVVDQAQIFKDWSLLRNFTVGESCVLVAPDKGALRKTAKVADALAAQYICANKVRDPLTTKIIATTVDAPIDPARHYLIVDDICDGGRTFIELAKVLREKGATKISLYVTHGIFSSGFGELSKHFNTIFTTNSFYPRYIGVYNEMNVRVFDIFSIM